MQTTIIGPGAGATQLPPPQPPTTEEQPQPSQQAMQEKAEKKNMRVMVAVDESEESFYGLRWALEKLFRSAGAEAVPQLNQELGSVTLVHVMQPFQHYVYPPGPAIYATPAVLESVREAREEAAAAILNRALQICKEKMIKTESLILEGDPKDMICQATEQMHVDLLVVGSRGLGRIKRALLGSVSDYCAHHAKCPVLIVKPLKEPTK